MKVGQGQPTSTWNHGFVKAPDLDQIRDGAKTLKPGHQGESVLYIKKLFNQIGANNPRYAPVAENENYDTELLKKVSRFQANHPEIFSRRHHGNVTRATLRALEVAAKVRDSGIETDPIPPDEPISNEGFYYEIKQGDVLDRVARRFKLGSHLDLLADSRNEGLRANPNAIKKGQRVWIPVAAPADSNGEVSDALTQPPRNTTGTVIRPGDSNPLVGTVRSTLRKLGYRGPLATAGNDYDHRAEVGVRWYQANFDSYRGRVDGIIGEGVWDGFRKELGVAPDKKPTEILTAPIAATPTPAEPIQPGVSVRTSSFTHTDTVRVGPNPVHPQSVAIPVQTPVSRNTPIMELPALRRRITRGKRGFDVEMGQRVLNRLGVRPPLDVDASAGGMLQAAVIEYQRSNNLETTNGTINAETWAKFAHDLGARPPPRDDIRFNITSGALTTDAQKNALGMMETLGAEDPIRARRLAEYAGVEPGEPLVVTEKLIDAIVTLGDRASMPMVGRGEHGAVSYDSARVFMTLLEPASPLRGLGVARGGGRVSTRTLDRTRHDAQITRIAGRYGVDPALVKAIMRCESSFNMTRNGDVLTSSAGALGLMQLMPDTAAGLGVNPRTVEGNIEGGVKYLAQQLRKYDGNIRKVAAAYNAGPGAVDKYKNPPHNGVPPYRETMGYVRKIQAAYEYYKATGQP